MINVRRLLRLDSTAPTGQGVRIGVLDSGIDHTHPDLADRVELTASRCILATFSDGIIDRYGHGTHVSGIIAGTGAVGGADCRGIAPDARLIAYRVSGSIRGYDFDVAKALEFAMNERLDIINFSAGFMPSCGPSPWLWGRHALIDDAFEAAAEAGILCVVSAGNAGPREGSVTRPGGRPCVLTVGMVNGKAEVHDMSGRGPYRMSEGLRGSEVRPFDSVTDRLFEQYDKPDVVAPGEDVFAPRATNAIGVSQGDFQNPGDPKCQYCKMAGTSQAAAVMTGLAAVALARARAMGANLGPNPGRTLRRLLLHAARPLAVGSKGDFGHGLVMWPILRAVIADFVNDPKYREVVLNDGKLRMM